MITIKKKQTKIQAHTHTSLFWDIISKACLSGCGRVSVCIGVSHQAIINYNHLMRCFDTHRGVTAVV